MIFLNLEECLFTSLNVSRKSIGKYDTDVIFPMILANNYSFDLTNMTCFFREHVDYLHAGRDLNYFITIDLESLRFTRQNKHTILIFHSILKDILPKSSKNAQIDPV